jgi:uncharacterized protein with NRDE domain
MCLAAFSIGQHSRFPFVLWSNRDEYFFRAAQAMDWWAPKPGGTRILSGRDLSAGGTWLGLNEAGQLALLTNVREPGRTLAVSPSRGELVTAWLTGQNHHRQGLMELGAELRNGFNLVAADLSADPKVSPSSAMAWWLSNRPALQREVLQTGLYGISNAALDTPWPKLQWLKRRLQLDLQASDDLQTVVAHGFAALADRTPAPWDQLPETGLPREREGQLSSVFVHITGRWPDQDYGTRCSTVIVVERLGRQRVVHVFERTFDRDAMVAGQAYVAHPLPSAVARPWKDMDTLARR